MLVFWGPGAPEIPGGHVFVQNTVVVEGRSARLWRASLKSRPKALDRRTVRELARALERFRCDSGKEGKPQRGRRDAGQS